jgi:hypothetical protein
LLIWPLQSFCLENAPTVEGAADEDCMSKRVFIQIASPSERNPAGVTCEGHYDVDDNHIVLVNVNGDAIYGWKRKIEHDGEYVAAQRLLRAWHRRPRPQADPLAGPAPYINPKFTAPV